MSEPLSVSFSAVSDFMACPRKWYYKYCLRKSPTGDSPRPMAFGTAFHEALAVYWGTEGDLATRFAASLAKWDGVKTGLSWEDQIIGAILLQGYAATWGEVDKQYWTHTVPIAERKIKVPLRDPDDNADPDMVLTIMMDSSAHAFDGGNVVIEHKTTTSDIEGEDYWCRAAASLQTDAYFIGSAEGGRHPRELIWDAVRAPNLRRRKATPVELRKYYVRGDRAGQIYDNQRETDETHEEFAQRFMEDVLSYPNKYFVRRNFTRTADELYDARCDLWAYGRLMLTARGDNGNCVIPAAPRNLGACNMYPTNPCEFVPVCKGGASIDDPQLYMIKVRTP